MPEMNFEDLFTLQPLSIDTLSRIPELLEEFQEECLLYKLNVHSSIYYLIAEESKILQMDYEK